MEPSELRTVFTIETHFDSEEGFGYLATGVDGTRVGWSTSFSSLLASMTWRSDKLRRPDEDAVAIALKRGTYPVDHTLPTPLAEGRVYLILDADAEVYADE